MKFAAGLLAMAAADSSVKVRSKDIYFSLMIFKIIGGSIPSAGSEPYIVSLQRLGSHFCGGTIVSANRVISAAHCKSSGVTAVGGAHDITANESSQQGKSVGTWVNHPNYSSRTQANDICVLKLSSRFTLNSRVATLAMPRSQNDEWMPSGASVRVCGWGNTRVSEINSQASAGRGRPHRPRTFLRRPDT